MGVMRDLDEVFAALKSSRFRAKFRLSEKDAGYLAGRGMEVVAGQAREMIERRLAAAEPVNDGRQTPWRGHPVFVAQHATATCCRSCLMKWHAIPKGRALSEAERGYVVRVICRWLSLQALPETLRSPGTPRRGRTEPPGLFG